MAKGLEIGGGASRRRFLAGSAALGATLAAPAIAQSRPALRIGVLNTFTGPLADAGDHNLNGMTTYFDEIGGLVGGRKIQIIKEDDQANPQIGLQKVKKLVEVDKVDLICGPQLTGVFFAAYSYIRDTKTFIVVSGAGTDSITWERYPYLFRTSISVWQLSSPMAAWVYANVSKELVLAATDFAGGRDVMRVFRKFFEAQGGKIIKEIYAPFGTNDYSAYLTDIRSLNPRATYNMFAGTDAVRYVQQYSEFGLKAKSRIVGFPSLIDASTLGAQGRSALGVITSTIYTEELENAANTKFLANYRAKFKSTPSLYSEYGYTAARTIAEAINAVDGDTADKDKLSQAMKKVTFEAPRGPFRMDPVVHHPVQNVYICEVKEIAGKIVNKDFAVLKDIRDPGVKDG